MITQSPFRAAPGGPMVANRGPMSLAGGLPRPLAPVGNAVRIAGGPSVAPQPHAWRPSRARMSLVQPKRELARSPQLGAFWQDIPLSVGLFGGGVGAMLLSGILPEPVQTITRVGGIGLLTWGFLNLFAGPVEAAPGATKEDSIPIPEKTILNQVVAEFLEPRMNDEVEFGLFSSDYDVKVLWINPTDKDISFAYDFVIEEWEIGLITGRAETPYRSVLSPEENIITLKAGKQIPIPIQIDYQTPALLKPSAIEVKLTVRKYDDQGKATPAAMTRFFVRS